MIARRNQYTGRSAYKGHIHIIRGRMDQKRTLLRESVRFSEQGNTVLGQREGESPFHSKQLFFLPFLPLKLAGAADNCYVYQVSGFF